MTPEVETAIDEIRGHFTGSTLLVGEDCEGGACVIVEEVPLGPPYSQSHSWIGFHITRSCPYADVYPHFVRADLTRADGGALGETMSASHQFPQAGVVVKGDCPTRPAVQISRRANRRDNSSGLETPLVKLLKVLKWTLSR